MSRQIHVEDLLTSMSQGQEQSTEAIEAFVGGVTDGSVTRPQAAAWLAWAFVRGLSVAETVALTGAMTHSGDVLSWPEGPELVDKHSTGGVGDKVSLILAPLWAALGRRVPMISGRGLGHTGGTLDKLEAIPGYRCDLGIADLRRVLGEVGCFISGQTGEVAPADRILYALRNETGTVPSIPLIVGSILSKKLAEGVQRLVLDVKCGSGAFMETPQAARALARALVDVAEGSGVRCRAVISEMGRPLGEAVGNAVEVEEAVACLKGAGPPDLRELTLRLIDEPDAAAALDDGRAYEVFCRMVSAQGGDIAALEDPSRLRGAGAEQRVVCARTAGVLQQAHARRIGRAAFVLGAGRRHASQAVDPGVGLRVLVRPGDPVEVGQPLARVFHRGERGLSEAVGLVEQALVVGWEPVTLSPLVHEIIAG